jgi:hypothetical protein
MRLLAEIIIAVALIYLGWDTPFKQWTNRASTAIQKLLPAKRQTPPGVIMIAVPLLQREDKS